MKLLLFHVLIFALFFPEFAQTAPVEPQNNLDSQQPANQSTQKEAPLEKEEIRPAQETKSKENQNIVLLGAVTGLVGGLIVAAINGCVSVYNSRRQIEDADRRNIRELALKAAFEEWKRQIEVEALERSRHPVDFMIGKVPAPDPLDFLILKKMKMFSVFSDKNLSLKQLLEKSGEMSGFYAALTPANKGSKNKKRKKGSHGSPSN